MKALLLSLVFVFGSELQAATYDSRAEVRCPDTQSEIFSMVRFQIDDAHRIQPDEPVGGRLVLNDKYVKIFIKMDFECPPDMNCPARMPQPIYAKLPVVSVEKTDCGIITTAERDQRSNGGLYERLRVIDYRKIQCKIYVENPLHVEYLTIEQEAHTSNFEFKAK